jgi:signal transduction histidine kinase
MACPVSPEFLYIPVSLIMILEPVLLFVFARWFWLTLRKKGEQPEWQKWLHYSMWGIGALFVIERATNAEEIIRWVWYALILFVIYIVYTREEFREIRNFMFAFLPLMLLNIVTNIFEAINTSWSKNIADGLEYAEAFALLWLIAMLIIANRQRKALGKTKKQLEMEEAERRIVEARKAELEKLVSERTAEINSQKEALQLTLNNLKETQDQLVHSEKMASLGELTAGIAHEIQNPLNFVNNFSEVNTELAHELQSMLEKLPITADQKQDLEDLVNDIVQNQEKIVYHGKRADTIVKSMLQHSRSSTGEKEETDINALADEYVRLSYHGLRAKDKSFNANFELDLDPSLGKIMAVPQDLGRVILNLVNNAFYAVNDHRKSAGPEYKPLVKLATRKNGAMVHISVEDNGGGISEEDSEKIFQPFFTTKPTGKGTGLGLSLSFDIITRGHGGKIDFESTPGKGTRFDILIPANTQLQSI